MNILVTGATGFIGSHLSGELIGRGHHVFTLSHSGNTANVRPWLAREEFHLQTGDIRDAETVRSFIKENRIKDVFHLAAQLHDIDSPGDPFSCFDINARGTLNVLHGACQGGVRRFVYASTMSVYSEPPLYLPVDEGHPAQPLTAYGATKLAGELFCNLYSREMAIVVLRYGGVYGQHERQGYAVPTFIEQALHDEPITICGDGAQTSDYVYIEDVVQGTLLAWEKKKTGVYNLGSGEETSVLGLAECIVNLTGSKSKITPTGAASERPFRFVLDITKARETLGYSPRSLEEGLSAYIKERELNTGA